MVATGLFQATLVAALLVAWARYVDRRPFAAYGMPTSPAWALDLAVGFVAVLVGHLVWYAVGTGTGWTDVTLVVASGALPLGVVLAGLFVAVGANAWVQAAVFVAVPVRNAAEGLASRGLTPRRAVLAGWAVATVLFATSHQYPDLAGLATLAIGLGIYALLYVHTGELALPVGVHVGVNYRAKAVFVPASAERASAVFHVTESLGGVAGILLGGRLPQLFVAYLLLLAWLWWHRGGVSIRTDVAEWTGR